MAAVAATMLLPCRIAAPVRRNPRRPPRIGNFSSSRKFNLNHHGYPCLRPKTSGKVICGQIEVVDGVDDEACELVNGADLIIGEGDDSIHAYLLKAVKNNNGTGVLLLSDIFGFEDSSTRDFAYRVACNGYKLLIGIAKLMKSCSYECNGVVNGEESRSVPKCCMRITSSLFLQEFCERVTVSHTYVYYMLFHRPSEEMPHV